MKALGPFQPWAKLPLQAARVLIGRADVGLVLINPTTSSDATRWQRSDIDALVATSDLLDTANTLHHDAEIFKNIMPMTAPASPDSGSASFDGILNSLVDAICLLHLQIAGDLDENSSRLRTAHNNDKQTDEDMSQRSAVPIQERSNEGTGMGESVKSPSPLAPCAQNWMGADVVDLAAFSVTLYSYVPEISAMVTAVDRKVMAIVHARWQDPVTEAFITAWERDSISATALGSLVSQTGDVVNKLAVDLSKIENALEDAAGRAVAAGIPIGPDGKHPQERYDDPNKESWRAAYQSFWNDSMLASSQARIQAAGELQKLYTQIAPPALG